MLEMVRVPEALHGCHIQQPQVRRKRGTDAGTAALISAAMWTRGLAKVSILLMQNVWEVQS